MIAKNVSRIIEETIRSGSSVQFLTERSKNISRYLIDIRKWRKNPEIFNFTNVMTNWLDICRDLTKLD